MRLIASPAPIFMRSETSIQSGLHEDSPVNDERYIWLMTRTVTFSIPSACH
jgi:hypothetical protein